MTSHCLPAARKTVSTTVARRLLAGLLTGLLAMLWAGPADAATTFSQVSLTATGAGTTVARRVLAGLLTGLLAMLWAGPADAATTFSQVSLTATVSGTTVTASASIRASVATAVDQYGICARDATGKIVDFPGKQADVTIATSATTATATGTFAVGVFTYYPCVLDGGKWSSVGKKTFTVTSAAPPTDGTVLFSDDFGGSSGAKPDASKWGEWSACTYNGSAAYGNIKCGERSTLDGQGHLSIPATPDTGTSISTADHFSFTYGTITARLKPPTEDGYWPAFWTLNNYAHPQPSNAPVVGEADVLEAYSFYNGYRRAVHNWSGDTSWSPAAGPVCNESHVLGEWHDYSAKFEPGKITFLFDGQPCGAVTTKAEGGGKPYAFGPDVTRPNWLLLTLAIGGAGGQQKPAVAPARLLVDRVEVRSL